MTKELTEISDAMVNAAKPDYVVLFGSRAVNAETAGSDYDIALIFENRAEVRSGLRKANRALWPRTVPVDLVGFSRDTWDNGKTSLAREIAQTGRVIYPKNESTS